MRDIEFVSSVLGCCLFTLSCRYSNLICCQRCLMTEVVYPEHLEEDGKDLIESLLERDPNKRPKFEGIESHPWMADVDFNPMRLKVISMPDWIIHHAAVEASPKTMRRSSTTSYRNQKKDITLSRFIQDICTQMVDVGNRAEAESAAARWLTDPSPRTVELFRGWNFVSDDAKSMEMNINRNRHMGFLSRIRSRRGTSDW